MTSHTKLSSGDFPHHLIVEEERGDKIECWGYRKSTVRTIGVYCAGILTCGALFLIIFYWKPDWGLRLTHIKCPHECADSIIVKDIYARNHKCIILTERVNTDPDTKNGPALSSSMINTISQKDMKLDNGNMRYFKFQKAIYIWDSDGQLYFKLRGLAHNVPCSDFYDIYSKGLDKEAIQERQQLYGLNEIQVRVRPILVLLLKEVMNPFYIFQLFVVIFWFSINYIYYTLCIVVMSAVSISVSLYTTRTESTRLRTMADVHETVEILRRNGDRETLTSLELVPGDVIIIPTNGCSLTCDAVLLTGNCIVNESMLTGESVPVTKTPLPNPQGVKMEYSMDTHKRHTLFCGTRVIQVRTHGDEVVKCVVTQTGFSTAKGQLVKSILYPKPTEIKLYRDALLFVGILTIIAIFGFIYTAIVMALQGASASKTAIHAIDIISIAVPPALPAVLTIGMVFAQFRLKKQGIYCISPQRINLCGTVDVVCFDKTGTLTEDGLDLLGVQPVTKRSFMPMVADAKLLSSDPISVAMATCHELLEVEEKITGDPLDIKMFEATGWTLDLGESVSTRVPGSIAVAKAMSADQLKGDKILEKDQGLCEIATLKIFPFASALQTMCVVAMDTVTRKTYALAKGSPEKISKISRSNTVPVDFQDVLDGYTKQGLRLIALAWKPININVDDPNELSTIQRNLIECDLEFIGLIILQNKLKPATTPAIAELNEANIRTIMVTGDNIFTAISVGRECGMVRCGATIMRVEAGLPCDHAKAKLVITPLIDDIVNDEEIDYHNHKKIRENESLVVKEEERQLIACDGTTFGIIRGHYPQMIPKIAAQGVIFARMSPDQKSQLVESLQSLGLSVGMCGDGANDCGALKQAHVGIALSEAEASVAAPFTSKTATISCIPTVIKEGRCAMVTSFGLFKFMAVYSLIMFSTVTVLTSVQYYVGDMQFFIIDIVLCTSFVLTVGANKAYHQISITRPITKLVTPPIIFSLIVQTLILLGFQVLMLILVMRQPWYEPSEIDSHHRNVVSYENMAVWLLANFQYLTIAFVNTPGPPYSNRFYKNIPLLIVFIVDFLICLGFLFYPPERIIKAFELKDIPSYTFKGLILFLAAIHFVIALFVENVLAPSKKLMNLVTCACCRKKKIPKYHGVELNVLKKPFMDLLSESETIYCE
ncbi:polyamine-transporting ATPase 13A3-like [Lytechinus pictus]|uniref:polyamine-transporting ATPase 13A3-like n=1 Tax=Lytechinus pictus TaxID=7653 RepID=UPI0030B9CADC